MSPASHAPQLNNQHESIFTRLAACLAIYVCVLEVLQHLWWKEVTTRQGQYDWRSAIMQFFPPLLVVVWFSELTIDLADTWPLGTRWYWLWLAAVTNGKQCANLSNKSFSKTIQTYTWWWATVGLEYYLSTSRRGQSGATTSKMLKVIVVRGLN